MVKDFIKASEEPQARQVEEDQRRAAEARAQEEARARAMADGQEAPTAMETPAVSPTPELRDGVRAVNPDTGSVGQENAPKDPNLNTDPQPENPENPQPQAEPIRPQEPESAIVSASQFEKSKKSFAGIGVDGGLWDTLDKGIEGVLSRVKQPEDLGPEMAFGTIEFLLTLIANYADHLRKDRDTRKKAYEEAVAAHDHDMGVTPLHKTLAVWAAIADHPAMRQYAGKPITPDVVRAAYDVYRTDSTARKAAILLVSSMTGREQKPDEMNKVLSNAFKAKLGGNTLQNLKGLALNDEKIKQAVDISGAKKYIYGMHQRNQDHQARVDQNAANRSTLRTAQHQQQNTNANVRDTGRSI